MFGRWGYFVGSRLFACFPVREKEQDLWIHLTAEDQTRALRDPRVRPHRRFGRRGWVELTIDDIAQMDLALRWLRRGWAAVWRGPAEDEPDA